MFLMILLGYIDPGSGLWLWQIIVAGFIGVVFYFKKTRDALVRAVKRLFGKD